MTPARPHRRWRWVWPLVTSTCGWAATERVEERPALAVADPERPALGDGVAAGAGGGGRRARRPSGSASAAASRTSSVTETSVPPWRPPRGGVGQDQPQAGEVADQDRLGDRQAERAGGLLRVQRADGRPGLPWSWLPGSASTGTGAVDTAGRRCATGRLAAVGEVALGDDALGAPRARPRPARPRRSARDAGRGWSGDSVIVPRYPNTRVPRCRSLTVAMRQSSSPGRADERAGREVDAVRRAPSRVARIVEQAAGGQPLQHDGTGTAVDIDLRGDVHVGCEDIEAERPRPRGPAR